MKKMLSLILCAMMLLCGCAFAESDWTLELVAEDITLVADGQSVALNPDLRLMMGNVPNGVWMEIAVVDGENLLDMQIVADDQSLLVSTSGAGDVLVMDMEQLVELAGVNPAEFIVDMDETTLAAFMDGTLMDLLIGNLAVEGLTVTRNSDTSVTLNYIEDGMALGATLRWNAVSEACPFNLSAKNAFPVDLNADIETLYDTDVATALLTDAFALLEEPSIAQLITVATGVVEDLTTPAQAA